MSAAAIGILARLAGVAAIVCALLLFSAITIVAMRSFLPRGGGGVISEVENNWLISLSQPHLRFGA